MIEHPLGSDQTLYKKRWDLSFLTLLESHDFKSKTLSCKNSWCFQSSNATRQTASPVQFRQTEAMENTATWSRAPYAESTVPSGSGVDV